MIHNNNHYSCHFDGCSNDLQFLFIVSLIVFTYHEDHATHDSFHETSNDYGVFDAVVSSLLSTFRLLLEEPLIIAFLRLFTHSLEV